MNRGIVITTSEKTKDWLMDCIQSLGSKYPVLIVGNAGYQPPRIRSYQYQYRVNDWNGYELGGIARGAEVFDEFVHLMDTCIVKDATLFDRLFEIPESVHLSPGFYSYLGKYKSEELRKIGIPKIETKQQAIDFEHHWNIQYIKSTPCVQFEPVLPVTTDIFIEKNGRKNMVLENDYLIKYKATWQ